MDQDQDKTKSPAGSHHHPHHVQPATSMSSFPLDNSVAGRPKNDTMALAVSATLHCLAGCGIGEVAGMVIGTWLLLGNIQTIILSVILGFIAGLLLGVVPLLRRQYNFKNAIRIVILGEGLSIAVMETFEVLTQVLIPGVMDSHLHSPVFWLGMIASLAIGFIAALPVNIIMIRRGIRHQH